jgi:hypothetical protein
VKKAAKTGAHCILATGNALRLSQLTDVEIRRQQQSQRQGVRR